LSYTRRIQLWDLAALCPGRQSEWRLHAIYRNGVLEASKTGMTRLVRADLDLIMGGIYTDFRGVWMNSGFGMWPEPAEIQAICAGRSQARKTA